jgi:ADP-ribose pyrophosphatase
MQDHVERLNRKSVYKGAIIDVYQDDVKLPDGKIEQWDFVAHKRGAAAVLAVLSNGNILMVRQYRPALDRYTLEIPAGARDNTEEPTEICARRELTEETGYIPGNMKHILSLKTTVAFCNEFIDVYLADNLHAQTSQSLDEAESIDVEEWNLDDLVRLIFEGTIQDSKTVSAILAYKTMIS